MDPISWAPAEIFPKGAKPSTPKKVDIFSALQRKKSIVFRTPKAQTKICVFLRRFRLNLWVVIASAERASENTRVFCRRAAHDVIFFKLHLGEGQVIPFPPSCGRPCLISEVFCFQTKTCYNMNGGAYVYCCTV